MAVAACTVPFQLSKMAALLQMEELVRAAEQHLEEFETTMGLTRVWTPGRDYV